MRKTKHEQPVKVVVPGLGLITTREVWLNLEPDNRITMHNNKRLADKYAGRNRKARKRVTITVGEYDD